LADEARHTPFEEGTASRRSSRLIATVRWCQWKSDLRALADFSGSMTTASWLSCGVSPTFNPVASRPAIDFGRSPGFPRARSSGDYRER
jgi:hypothetical protein